MRKLAALLVVHLLLAASCAELVTQREAPKRPDAAVPYTATLDEQVTRDESLIASLRALQRFHGLAPSPPYRVAASTGTARLLAAHPTACPSEWSRGGRVLGLQMAGQELGLALEVLEPNPGFDDPEAPALESLKSRRNLYAQHHRDRVLGELSAGRPVLGGSGWSEGGAVAWGLITRYNGESDTLYGHPSGQAAETSLDFPPEAVVLVQPTGNAPTTDDVALLRHALGAATRIAAASPPPEVGAEPGWHYGLAALDAWRARLSIIPFCRFCGTGSWHCQQRAAGALILALRRAQELLAAAAPALPSEAAALAGPLRDLYAEAIESLVPSTEDAIEAKFHNEPGQRTVAFSLTQLRKALEQAQGLEKQLLAGLGAASANP